MKTAEELRRVSFEKTFEHWMKLVSERAESRAQQGFTDSNITVHKLVVNEIKEELKKIGYKVKETLSEDMISFSWD